MSNIQSIGVYLGSSGYCRPIFKQTAEKLGVLIAQSGKTLSYGGMDVGLMGIVANNALEAGAKVVGIVPTSLKDSQRIHPNLSKTILVESLWERKLGIFDHMDAAIVLAGGFGTVDEMFEVLYWAHLGAHAKPVVLVNTDGYYDEMISFMDTLPDLPTAHFMTADTLEEAFTHLDEWSPQPLNDKTVGTHPHFEDEILKETEEPLIIDTASVKDTYILATALSLKQIERHDRPIGILNIDGQFDLFLKWVERAQDETFITKHCTELFSVAPTMEELKEKLAAQPKISIDLSKDKWGPSQTGVHLELSKTTVEQ